MGIADENDLFAVQRTGLEHLGWFRNYGVNSFLGDGCSCRAICIFCVCERIAVVATGIQTKQYGQEQNTDCKFFQCNHLGYTITKGVGLVNTVGNFTIW